MYFKKLELIGFKSFSEKTTLRFDRGITAIVGPNGTGKSNIFDSIRWVLGEQSAKSLRGSEMQDVIFNGTDTKEPVGMAEVTLTFDNEKRFFNVDHPEVAITRRLFRSGESEYLLNKTSVRLKDILDLLMGTGVGAESYSIVAQGKIDLVLSSRPEDRRVVFDEASGITKYKAQKRETLRKLEETEQNLLRVNDIITEVKRQIGSLERQANKARRYKEVFEELKTKETNASVLEKNELWQEKSSLDSQIVETQACSNQLHDAIREHESKISNRQQELKSLEDNILEIKNQILNLENSVVRNNEHITFNKERIVELEETKKYLEAQSEQLKCRLVNDEEKLENVRKEYEGLKKNIEIKTLLLNESQAKIDNLDLSIKNSLEVIARSKKSILDLVTRIAHARNEAAEFNSQQQIFLARKKRLDIEKAKVFQERSITEGNLKNITEELDSVKKAVSELNLKISGLKSESENQKSSLESANLQILELDKERLALLSHKEFLEELKTKYNDIGETMNAVIFLDRQPSQNLSGLVVKINQQAGVKVCGEAKPIELDTRKIDEKLNKLQEEIKVLKARKQEFISRIEELDNTMLTLGQELRAQEIALANKETSRMTVLEQFNKIQEEEEVIVMELSCVQKELLVLEKNIEVSNSRLSELSREQRQLEDLILQEEELVSQNSKSREKVLVNITQTKTELDSLKKRTFSDEATLKMLDDVFRQDKDALVNLEKQLMDAKVKRQTLESEILDSEAKIKESQIELKKQNDALHEFQQKHSQVSSGTSDVVAKIESDRKELEALKDNLYKLQMQAKDIDYRYASIKDRMLQAYKIDIEACELSEQGFEKEALIQEIEKLKEKLDSYGTVNLVAIEEYDELKKRYDFLLQQQNDLLTAKESLHQAILKINRTTKEMFLETFEKVRVEFRNYFRLLFNGGDAQLFLIDEQDPLESGIEIICRPPGKKLQNVLLLSGGEKSLSAIALIFAIFKVKPSPFCVLDEIDAALDEANVDRFSMILQEFARESQFIVVTHNKRTIVNANVMYGITMEESGISKIVSVKFAKDSSVTIKDKETDAAVA